jgi:uncharacterized surface protein with fasciclin (FAS1) repeats
MLLNLFPPALPMTGSRLLVTLALAAALMACGDADRTASSGLGERGTLSAVTDTTSLLTVLRMDDRFSTFVTALDSAGLDSALAHGGPFTVFAPTNAAFDALPPGTVPDLLGPDGHDRLRVILDHHLLPRRLSSQALVRTGSVRTRAGGTLPVRDLDGTVQVDSIAVIASDVETGNGTIHVLDGVLPPPE